MSVTEKMKTQVTMFYEAKRLETFKDWHFADDKSCSRTKLAEAGFYFIGTSKEPDAVECFCCRKALDGWEEVDNPWVEHQNHSSNCNFAKLGKPEQDLTLRELMELKKTTLNSLLIQSVKQVKTLQHNQKKGKLLSLGSSMGVKKR